MILNVPENCERFQVYEQLYIRMVYNYVYYIYLNNMHINLILLSMHL